MNFFRTL